MGSNQPDQANVLRRMKAEGVVVGTTIVVVGAKGGVGTSVVTLALAEVLSRHQSVLVIDGNWGQSDLPLLARLSGMNSLKNHTVSLNEWLIKKEPPQSTLATGVTLVPGASGDLPQPLAKATGRLFARLTQTNAAVTIIDAGTASTPWAQALTAQADQTLLVATPDQHAVVSAYASAKRLRQTEDNLSLVWNGCPQVSQAETAQQRILATCESAGEPPLTSAGWLPARKGPNDTLFTKAARMLATGLMSGEASPQLERQHTTAA